jgi:hypothetical protein
LWVRSGPDFLFCCYVRNFSTISSLKIIPIASGDLAAAQGDAGQPEQHRQQAVTESCEVHAASPSTPRTVGEPRDSRRRRRRAGLPTWPLGLRDPGNDSWRHYS